MFTRVFTVCHSFGLTRKRSAKACFDEVKWKARPILEPFHVASMWMESRLSLSFSTYFYCPYLSLFFFCLLLSITHYCFPFSLSLPLLSISLSLPLLSISLSLSLSLFILLLLFLFYYSFSSISLFTYFSVSFFLSLCHTIDFSHFVSLFLILFLFFLALFTYFVSLCSCCGLLFLLFSIFLYLLDCLWLTQCIPVCLFIFPTITFCLWICVTLKLLIHSYSITLLNRFYLISVQLSVTSCNTPPQRHKL